MSIRQNAFVFNKNKFRPPFGEACNMRSWLVEPASEFVYSVVRELHSVYQTHHPRNRGGVENFFHSTMPLRNRCFSVEMVLGVCYCICLRGMDRTVLVLWGRINRVEFQRIRTGIDNVMLRSRRNDDCCPVLNN